MRLFGSGYGDKKIRTIRFATISSGTSGTVTLPQYAEVVLDCFGGLTDAVITNMASGRPGYAQVFTAGGAVVAATFDTSGNYTLSGTPSSYPVAILYQVRTQLQYFDSESTDIVEGFAFDDAVAIGDRILSGLSNSVLFTDASGLLAQNSRFTWLSDRLSVSANAQLYEDATGVVLWNRSNSSSITIMPDGNMTFYSAVFGSFTLEAIAADLVQISGPYLVNNVNSPLVDYSGAGLILQYASLDIAWDLEGGYINRPNGTLFVDMVFDYMSDSNGIVFFDILQRIFSDETGANSIVFGSAGIEMYNKVIRYNSVFTAGVGMPSITYEYKTTGSTAALNNNYTTAATAGQYRITVTCVTTGAWTVGTLTCTLAWNNGTAKTKSLFTTPLSLTVVGSEEQAVFGFDVAASTTINITTAIVTPTGTGTYRFKSIVERIG